MNTSVFNINKREGARKTTMRAGNYSHSAECANCRKLTDNFADAMDVQSFSYEYDVWAQFHQSTPWKAVGGGRYSTLSYGEKGY